MYSTSIVVLNSIYEITKIEVGEGRGRHARWKMGDGRSEGGDGTLICTFTRGVTAACGYTNCEEGRACIYGYEPIDHWAGKQRLTTEVTIQITNLFRKSQRSRILYSPAAAPPPR